MYKIYNNSKCNSGNNTTLTRISKLLNLELTNKICNKIIGIHAFKFGSKVINKNIDFILIIGGTDINIDIHDEKKLKVIYQALDESKFIVCFSDYIKKKINYILPNSSNKIIEIAQSVIYENPSNYNLINDLPFVNKDYLKYFIVVGNIRNVKDPFYLESVKNILIKKNIIIIYIGDILEDTINFNYPFIHIGSLKPEDIYSCYKYANGLLNLSISEGMSGSILEAMLYKCPVYARANEGNLSIITHNYNGFIFNSPNEFIDCLSINTHNIMENAYNYVIDVHNPKIEKEKYNKLLSNP